MNYQTINAKELTQKAVEKHGSQSSVAKITGVNHALLSKMIKGELTNPTLRTINKLLECLNQQGGSSSPLMCEMRKVSIPSTKRKVAK